MNESVMRVINAMSRSEFVATFGSVFKDAPWAAEEAYECRPFSDSSGLKSTMMAMVRGAPEEARLRVLRSYPGLDSVVAVASPREQIISGTTAPAGLDQLSPEEFAQFRSLNKSYHERFDMPFILYAEGNTAEGVMKLLEQRLRHEPEVEEAIAFREVGRFADPEFEAIFQKLAAKESD
ncbi:2-oxo-4-hydroxy-4-carboxy-5-ureidoimidazoline decarboxylase [Acetobacter cerevisiae]|uniref:2-oxo-4-hydroxy-4-carboxy-5-ureidoimidazoline decarboxylase n=2 Tax=Acetobacter cerevisiae TaxID=178900 RepID=A0ABT1EQ21_9PROT|nr:2-oxo-4-hydroxy-4-carboxy-5-ureidoimidazoline decarboxylase [Acetobacter cerevisiae]MCP1245479.1 2-oxo-4-hydroxy-4-carboxy-5-ureidoimidazoline decarboxylase [Acetobacter cerevisiae]MCP1255054.1 2-oxo-4-hydroxy-4-carboxy-5-ureidoimidazoline decarboxylase [Acetobacter cerevisiae]